ncbi:MAG: type II restriction endonuclease [Acidobacteriota bacterium]
MRKAIILFLVSLGAILFADAQATPRSAKAETGSLTAKNGFRNETEIAGKFNNWRTDTDAQTWLAFMGYKTSGIKEVLASKPHGEKADVEVKITTADSVAREGISIKLVSSNNGFNQIDKRWLAHYAIMWKMPAEVVESLKLFVGESKPIRSSKVPGRMYLNELDTEDQKRILDFFKANRDVIVSDLFRGDGEFDADWIMVALKSTDKPRWILRRIDHAIEFFSGGPVEITRNGNLRIGRITMQRKGGDGGRETAKMLQFKINPALLFDKN